MVSSGNVHALWFLSIFLQFHASKGYFSLEFPSPLMFLYSLLLLIKGERKWDKKTNMIVRVETPYLDVVGISAASFLPY